MTDATLVYADYQATTPVDPRVIDAMMPFWHDTFGNPTRSSIPWAGKRHTQCRKPPAPSGADRRGCRGDHLHLGRDGSQQSRAVGLANGAPQSKNRLLVSPIEHKSVLAVARALAERQGFVVETLAVDHQGFVDPDALRQSLDDDVLMVSIMAVNNEVGTIQPIAELGEILAEHAVVFHCDAAQAPWRHAHVRLGRPCGSDQPLEPQDLWASGARALFVRHTLAGAHEPGDPWWRAAERPSLGHRTGAAVCRHGRRRPTLLRYGRLLRTQTDRPPTRPFHRPTSRGRGGGDAQRPANERPPPGQRQSALRRI